MGEHQKIGYEKSDIDVLKVFLGGFVPAVLIVISIIALGYIYQAVLYREYDKKGRADVTQIQSLSAKDSHALNTYGKSEFVEGRYRIPIDRAVQLILEENGSK